MYNKFKVKKKLISIALALVLAAQPLATPSMNVFAGTGKNGVIKAPKIKLNPALLKMTVGQKIDSTKYTVNNSIAFSAGGDGTAVDSDGKVSSPGIICVTDVKTGEEKYIVSDAPSVINYVLKDLKKQLQDLQDLGFDLDEIFEDYADLLGGGGAEVDSPTDTSNSLDIVALKKNLNTLRSLKQKAEKGEQIDAAEVITVVTETNKNKETIIEEKIKIDPTNEEYKQQLLSVQKQTELLEEASDVIESAASNASTSQSSSTPEKIEVTKITIEDAPDAIDKGNSVQLTAKISPSNSTDKKVKWSSSDTNVAIVSSQGRVTALMDGEITITAKAGNQEDTCTIKVTSDNLVMLKMTIGQTIDSTKYTIQNSIAFSTDEGGTAVDNTSKVINPGIIHVKNVSSGKNQYIVIAANLGLIYLLQNLENELLALESLGIDVDTIFYAYPKLFTTNKQTVPSTPNNSAFISGVIKSLEDIEAIAEKAQKGQPIADLGAINAMIKLDKVIKSAVEEKLKKDPTSEQFNAQLTNLNNQIDFLNTVFNAINSN